MLVFHFKSLKLTNKYDRVSDLVFENGWKDDFNGGSVSVF